MINAVVIIGHGPGLQKSGLGDFIDSFKYVVRFMHLGNWQVPEDYGTKTTYMCATVGRVKRERKAKRKKGIFCPHVPENGYFFWSKTGGELCRAQKKLIKKYGGKNVTSLICRWQKLLKHSRHPFFCHGTAGICIATHKIKRPVIVLACGNLKDGKGLTKDYVGSWKFENRKSRGIGHDLAVERKLIDQMARACNTTVTFIETG
jgi:hypothetical protein